MELFKKHWKILLVIVFAALWVNSCSSNSSNSREVRDLRVETDSLKNEVAKAYQFKAEKMEEMHLMFQIETLKSEKRSVLNINQIFLRKKRPDNRVIEIDKEVQKLEKELNSVQ